MPKILVRYIAKNILIATFFVALIISGVLFLLLMLGELKSIGDGDYGLVEVIIYVLLRLPNQLYQFSPMFILLGSIIGLSMLASNRELSVMRASGFSVRKIIYGVLGAAFILILAMGFIGEWIAPSTSYMAEVRKENARNADQAVVTSRGVWFHIDNNFIHIQHAIGRQLMENVIRYKFDDKNRLKAAYFAKTLSFQNKRWQVTDVFKTTFYKERTASQFFEKAEWKLKFNSNLLNVGLVEPNEMSLYKLAKFAHYLKHNGLQANQYEYNFWQRIFQPLVSLVMISLAIPFVLGTLSSSTMGWRIVFGIMIGFAFFISNSFLGQLCIVYQLPAVFAALLPLIIFALFGIFLSKQLIKY